MLSALVGQKDGAGPILILALTAENWQRMKDGHPIMVGTDSFPHGPGVQMPVPLTVVLLGGEDEDAALAQIRERGVAVEVARL